MIAYKVIRNEDNARISLYASMHCRLKYTPKQKVLAPKQNGKIAKIFVFDTLRHACDYARVDGYNSWEIWQCQVPERGLRKGKYKQYEDCQLHDIDWPADLDEEYNRSSICCSVGTHIVPTLTLLEKIHSFALFVSCITSRLRPCIAIEIACADAGRFLRIPFARKCISITKSLFHSLCIILVS